MRNQRSPLHNIVLTLSFLFISLVTHAENIRPDNAVLQDIYMFHEADAYRYGSGQPTPEQLNKLGKAGINIVINLRPHSEFDDSQEQKTLKGAGIEYHNIAIDGAKGLSEANIMALDKILSGIDSKKNVLMHCASSNRVGAMMALRANWLQGASKEESLAIGEKYGMKSLKTTVQFKLK